MPTSRDFLPLNWAAFAVWMANFVTQLAGLQAKYSVSNDSLEALQQDNDWVQFWAPKRDVAKQQAKQMTDYVEGVRKGALGAPALSNPVWSLGTMPPTVAPGINARIREVANFIKAQKSIYTQADGELLGIVTLEETGRPENEYVPALKLGGESNYGTEADFRLMGTDALRVEYRFEGETEWKLAAILTSSPGVFNIVPQTAGKAEMVQIRAVFIVDNQPFGEYSPIYSIVVKP